MGEAKQKVESENLNTEQPTIGIKKARRRGKWLIVIILILIIVGGGGFGLWHHFHKTQPAAVSAKVSKNPVAFEAAVVANDKTATTKASDLIDEGNLLLAQNKTQSAITAYKQANTLTPNQVNIQTSLAQAYVALKDKTNAILFYSDAVKLIQSNPNSSYAPDLTYYQGWLTNLKQGSFQPPQEPASEKP